MVQVGARAPGGLELDRGLPQIPQQFEVEGAALVVLALRLQQLRDSHEPLPIAPLEELLGASRFREDLLGVSVDARAQGPNPRLRGANLFFDAKDQRVARSARAPQLGFRDRDATLLAVPERNRNGDAQ